MEVAGPDLTEFAEAQAVLRSFTGQMVTFYFASTLTWPEGTQLDPESGKPYDPKVDPEEVEEVTPVEIKCNVVFRPVRGTKEDTTEAALGNIKNNECVLIMSADELSTVDAAVSFDVKGDNYLVKKSTTDGIGSDYRGLMWGERQGASS